MSVHLSPLQADVLAILGGAEGPLNTTEVRNQLNAHRTRAVPEVAEQVYRALCRLQRHALVRRAQVSHTRNIYWQTVLEQQEAG
jgi:Fe2+ or Zn2+ uptake regulation protein